MLKGEVNETNWRDNPDILTDSLWLFDKRDRQGEHNPDYHGNFIPQIPNQLIRRFTQPNDVVLDMFLGSGTTMIEAIKLGRRIVGIDISPDMIEHCMELDCFSESNSFLMCYDSTDICVQGFIKEGFRRLGVEKSPLAILHPPYWNIIQFTKSNYDLSNTSSVESFLFMFGDVVSNLLPLVSKGGHVAVVIGDCFVKKEWIPLSHYVCLECLNHTFLKLKGIVVKDIQNNRAKRNQENLWKYRALKGGTFVFKHEYMYLFEVI